MVFPSGNEDMMKISVVVRNLVRFRTNMELEGLPSGPSGNWDTGFVLAHENLEGGEVLVFILSISRQELATNYYRGGELYGNRIFTNEAYM